MIKAFLIPPNDCAFLSSQGEFMTRLPSGQVYVSGGAASEFDLTLNRLGAEFIGEIDEDFNASAFDHLCKRLWEIRGSTSLLRFPD